MNFLIYAVQEKGKNKIPYQGFSFTYQPRLPDKKFTKKEIAEAQKTFLDGLGLDPKKYKVHFAHYTTLKKLRKSMWKCLWTEKNWKL